VHRFLTPGVGSEFASDRLSSDRISDSSKLYLLGSLLAPRFLCQWLAENFCAKFAGSFTGSLGNGDRRRGGVFMQLKMWVLSGTALILWLAPLAGLDKSIRFHKWTQGLSLCAAIGCAIVSGNIARELSEQGEIEEIKTRAITADVVDVNSNKCLHFPAAASTGSRTNFGDRRTNRRTGLRTQFNKRIVRTVMESDF
jgi:hypothetical protein